MAFLSHLVEYYVENVENSRFYLLKPTFFPPKPTVFHQGIVENVEKCSEKPHFKAF